MQHVDLFDEYNYRIESSQGIQGVIDKLNELAQDGQYVFRGYGKQDELYPAIIRKENYTKEEQLLLEEFEHYGSNYFHATTPIDFMSYAQHFGLPTRLLDFTHNPFIALSFALHTPKSNGKYQFENDKDYYYIRYASIKENICIPSIPLSEDAYNNKWTRTDSLATKAAQCIDSMSDLFGQNVMSRNILSLKGEGTIDYLILEQQKIDDRVMLFVDPNQSNQRIIMQQGLFMFPYTLNKREHIDIIANHSKCILIHKDLRNELLRYLDTLGFNAFRLMPDLSSICDAVKRRVLDERNEKKR